MDIFKKMQHTTLRNIFLFLCLLFLLNAKVRTGLENFLHFPFYRKLIANKKIGLITNPTGVNSQLISNIDLMHKNPYINLVALFAPEHGVRGDMEAGKHLKVYRDGETNLPVYPLYWKKKYPHPSHFKKVDTLIYDIQDIGARPYTFIWSLTKILEMAQRYNKHVIILDRPCPLGANNIDGPLVDAKYKSFLGLYPIPRTYGMTIGELANYLNTEHHINAKLSIIPMSNYRRDMTWEETGLPWIPTSPNIPSITSALCYSITGGLGLAGTKIYIGINDPLPFQVVATQWIDAQHMVKHMNSLRLPGLRFSRFYTQPKSGFFRDKRLQGVQIHILNHHTFRPCTAEIALYHYLLTYYPDFFKWERKVRDYAIVIGNDKVQQQLLDGYSHFYISNQWQKAINNFKKKRQKYLIYR